MNVIDSMSVFELAASLWVGGAVFSTSFIYWLTTRAPMEDDGNDQK